MVCKSPPALVQWRPSGSVGSRKAGVDSTKNSNWLVAEDFIEAWPQTLVNPYPAPVAG